jgi:conjugative relaxase-like TrwC/TraI family protein
MDLVISAHKSLAELGVIGRVEDMHAILDAERDATLTYLDEVVRESGGRRGRDRVPTPTHGLTYASTRHATSRAGDPCPHDHVLVANVVEMADPQGGFKALDTLRVRDHLHAATMVGRLAGAQKAVELGYAICPDDGTSGRLGHWAIDGIPDEVMVRHSKRSMEIDDFVERGGHSSWRARQVAALRTRDVKRHTPVEDLLPRWRQELAEIGWPINRLNAEVEGAARRA